jgi:tetratricopeptide (TPR) repeat protein
MLKTTKKQILRNLFIFSTSIEERVNQRIQHLTYQARQAYYLFDFRKTADCAKELLDLSPRSEFAGLYFQALSISQYGNNKSLESEQIYKMLAQNAPPAVQSAAFLALGLNALQSNQLDDAEKLLSEAYDIGSNGNCAPITQLQVEIERSTLHSINGNHHKCVSILENLMPSIARMGQLFPSFSAIHLNNYAYELNLIGEHQKASQVIGKVLSSPYANISPEIQETAKEIQEAQAKLHPNRSSVSIPKQQSFNVINIAAYQRDHFAKYREMYAGKVLRFPVANNRFHITLTSKDNIFNLCNLDIDDSQESEERLIEFLYLLNFLCTDSKTDYIVRGFVSPENSGMFEFNGNIQFDELDKLFTLINNVETHALNNPLPNRRVKAVEETQN